MTNLPFALRDGKEILACEAEFGIPHDCPWCDTKVHRQRSSLGRDFWATYPGRRHTGDQCAHISLATEEAKVQQSRERTHPHRLMRGLLTPPDLRDGSDRGSATGSGRSEGLSIVEGQAFRSLKQLYESGTYLLPADARLGSGAIGDVFVCTPQAIAEAIADRFYAGEKIFLAAVDPVQGEKLSRMGELLDEGTYVVWFTVYSRTDGKYTRKTMMFEAENEKTQRQLMDLLYERKMVDGKIVYEPQCQRVLVAGDWEAVSCRQCMMQCSENERLERSCVGGLVAPYRSGKQIFGLPVVKKRKKIRNEADRTNNADATVGEAVQLEEKRVMTLEDEL